jgi:hypothetical protein
MVQITLTSEEATTLREVLDNYVSELRMEIANTDSMDFREELKQKKEVLNRVIAQLVAGLAPQG